MTNLAAPNKPRLNRKYIVSYLTFKNTNIKWNQAKLYNGITHDVVLYLSQIAIYVCHKMIWFDPLDMTWLNDNISLKYDKRSQE